MIIVVDTNVFVRDTHLLRKKGGPALVRLLRATKGQILIPEILQREYVEQTVKAADDVRSRVMAACSTLETLLGTPASYTVPDVETVRLRAIDRLRALEALTIFEPLSPDLHVAAGNRSLANKRPTSKSDHGYKDCLIWESVLRLPRGSDVRFVSRDDKAFFDGDAFHPGLIAEARELGITVVGYRDIERVVEELTKANPTLDLAAQEALGLDAPLHDVMLEAIARAPVPRPAKASDDRPASCWRGGRGCSEAFRGTLAL